MRKSDVFILLALAALAFFMSGCRDMVELEDRAFAGAFAIDKAPGGGVSVCAEMISEIKDTAETEREVREARGGTLSGAFAGLDGGMPKKLFCGLAKVCLLGEGLLEDPGALSGVVDMMGRGSGFNPKMALIAVKGSAVDALKSAECETTFSAYIQNIYRNNKGLPANVVKADLETLSAALAKGEGTAVGALRADGGESVLSGAAVIGDGLEGFADEEDIHGLVWLNEGMDARITVESDGAAVFRADRVFARYSFGGEDGSVYCEINIDARGGLEEYSGELTSPERINTLEKLFARAVSAEVARTYEVLRGLGADAFGLEKRLFKSRPDLTGTDTNKINLTVNAVVKLNITNFK